jgi:hypothetical protein
MLAAAASSSNIREIHAISLLERLAMNQEARSMLWGYVNQNTEDILDNSRYK